MSSDSLEDAPPHEFEPQDRLPDRCGFDWHGMMCGYDQDEHAHMWAVDWQYRRGVTRPAPAEAVTDAEDDAEVIRREREQHLAVLSEIPQRRARLAEHERTVVRYARMIGMDWPEIAEAVGGTADEARQRYGEPGPGEDPF